MNKFNITIRQWGFLLVTLLAGYSFAQHTEPNMNSDQTNKDVYKAGATVQVSTHAPGDAVVAGGSISISNYVAEDVLAAGGTINITADVGDDIRAAGGSIAIMGDVGDDVVIAGGTVILDSTSTIGGQAWLAGGTITVEGNVNHGLQAAGGTIILAGTIGGDVELQAESIEIKPGAVIKGNLRYSAPAEADIDKSATILGEVNYKEIEFEVFDAEGTSFVGGFVFYLSLAASAIALFLLFPRRSISVVRQIQETPFKSAGIGLIVLFSITFIAMLLLVSVLGVPVGLIVLTLYFAAMIIGLLIGATWLGDKIFRQIGKQPDESKLSRSWSIVTAAATLLVIGWIPVLGGWVFFIVMLLGIGGITQYAYQLYDQRDLSLPNNDAAKP